MKTKPNIPKVETLRTLYKGLTLTLDRIDQVGLLRNIVDWYTTSGPFCGPAVYGAKEYERAIKTADQGLHSGTALEEADNALKFSIRQFEKLFQVTAFATKLPNLKESFDELEQNRATLEAKEARRRSQFEPYLDAMNQVFNGLGVKYEAKVQPKNRLVGIDKTIRVSETYAQHRVQSLKHDLVPILMEEVPAVVRALSLAPNETGQLAIDLSLVNTNMTVVMDAVADKLRKGVKVVTITPTAAPVTPTVSTPRPAPVRMASSGGSLFRSGTLTAEIYDRLLASLVAAGGTVVTLCSADLTKGLSSGDVGALINDVVAKGKKTGVFSLTKIRGAALDLRFEKF